MILTDAGPLIALVDRRDAEYGRCVSAAEELNGPMLTTWPAFTEAMYLLGARGGWPAQEQLWRMIAGQHLVLADTNAGLLGRISELMAQYRNVPMDVAGASLVAVAEHEHLRVILTLDSDFLIYRLADGSALQIVPGDS